MAIVVAAISPSKQYASEDGPVSQAGEIERLAQLHATGAITVE
ncbi:hypothetical protein [Pontimonas salivibrio]|nr:hypothetical protein [Pontimonas salivibrio]